jgi:hypothetical protein
MTGIYPNHLGNTDTGQMQYPTYAAGIHTAPYPMMSVNGCEHRKTNRRPSQSDVDDSPYPIRRYTNMSVTDVQLNNGLRARVASGKRINYRGTGYLWTINPLIPGQTRDNAAGFHKRGPSPYNVSDVWTNGPGAQPEHPGGPGKIAATTFINPMSG